MYYNRTFKNKNVLDAWADFTVNTWAFPLQIHVDHVLKDENMPINLIGFDIQFFCFYFSVNYWYE